MRKFIKQDFIGTGVATVFTYYEKNLGVADPASTYRKNRGFQLKIINGKKEMEFNLEEIKNLRNFLNSLDIESHEE